MKTFVYVGHPKDVYVEKQLLLRENVFCFASNKDITIELLNTFDIKYIKASHKTSSIIFKVFAQIYNTIKILHFSVKKKPEMYLGAIIPSMIIVAWVLRKPYIAFHDTESADRLVSIFYPFISVLITSSEYKFEHGYKQIRVQANFECSYLHSKIFKPNQQILKHLHLLDNERFIFLRFVSWDAFHDKGHKGLSIEAKRKAVTEFSKYGKIFISTEYPIEAEFKKYELNLPIHLIHSLEYYAALVFGESPTMTTESAMLGTPSICISSWAHKGLGNFEELQEHGLSYSFHPNNEIEAIRKGIEILQEEKKVYKEKAEKFMKEKINLSAFLIWFIENYPESHKIMQENPSETQRRFL